MADTETRAPKDAHTASRRLATACGARVGTGKYCKRKAGWGTDHPGTGLCKRHGGNSERSLKRAGMALAHEGIMSPDIHPGDIVEIEPHNALLWSVMIAGGDVSYWQNQLHTIGEELAEAIDVGDEDEEKRLRALLNEAFRHVRSANREMRQSGKMAIDAGLAERQVLMAERMAGLLATFAQGLLGRLDLSPADMRRLPTIIQEEIMNLEAPDGTPGVKPKLALTAHKKDELYYTDR